MTDFVTDRFIGDEGTPLSAHIPDLGGSWVDALADPIDGYTGDRLTLDDLVLTGNPGGGLTTGSGLALDSRYFIVLAPGTQPSSRDVTVSITLRGDLTTTSLKCYLIAQASEYLSSWENAYKAATLQITFSNTIRLDLIESLGSYTVGTSAYVDPHDYSSDGVVQKTFTFQVSGRSVRAFIDSEPVFAETIDASITGNQVFIAFEFDTFYGPPDIGGIDGSKQTFWTNFILTKEV